VYPYNVLLLPFNSSVLDSHIFRSTFLSNTCCRCSGCFDRDICTSGKVHSADRGNDFASSSSVV